MPMRVIAKKKCRAMFEPPEKGERATLNSNLSTRLNLLFSDQALGRRVGYCWSRRASVPRLILNAKTLKLCSKIKFATQAQQTAPSRYAVERSRAKCCASTAHAARAASKSATSTPSDCSGRTRSGKTSLSVCSTTAAKREQGGTKRMDAGRAGRNDATKNK